MFGYIRKISWYIFSNKKRYAFIVIFLLIANVLDIIPPQLIGRTIDLINNGELTQEMTRNILIIFAAVIILSYTVSYWWGYLLFEGAIKIESILRSRLMRKFLLLSPSFYERSKTGDLMAKATNDLRTVNMATGFGIITLLDATTFLLTIVLVMGFTISWQLTFFALIPLPLLAIIEQRLGKMINKRHKSSQEAFGVMNDAVLEVVEGVRLTRSYVQEDAENNRFKRLTDNYLNKFMKVEKLDAFFQPLTIIVVSSSIAISFSYGAVLVNSGAITVGELITFNVYLNMLIWPMFALGMLFNIMERGNASYDRIQHVLDETDDLKAGGEETVKETNFNFNEVSFKYPTGKHNSLENITIELNKGETLGIVGRTGSGKSTFIKQLLKIYPEGTGDLVIDGINISNLNREKLREKLGYVSQENILFSRTVRENIMFGKPDATEAEMMEAIRLSAFDEDLKRMPEGLDTLVGEKGVSLSGGQKQRISIARSLIRQPDILILDDALSAVDARTEQRIINHIKNNRLGKTTIIITHRLSAVHHADKIIVLDNGRIVESGTHEQLSEGSGWYSAQNDYFITGGES
ncbi:putative multidrug resistance ABC transporter ATP-binding/permease protein YheI [Jeotgalicoccus saudimassiliensis]|uniref:Putative multidrug resistance ABC transporter ATP-binding/permease protein YheI n=1 Tax=Jeotgalicoccus saudimassiliensis TaxID=1461582 RepID=A0A078LYE8_9STAP|nr:ABC transporter ATP-binding protein [Jeotgalicoccus saudimassiliensis]CDZ99030.1 putative multidrug resistance ABC transporter ATP-binding/permease protein YheI [Jeotgalicoccus saudimassiliensis]